MSLEFKEPDKDADVGKCSPLPVIQRANRILDWSGWKRMVG